MIIIVKSSRSEILKFIRVVQLNLLLKTMLILMKGNSNNAKNQASVLTKGNSYDKVFKLWG